MENFIQHFLCSICIDVCRRAVESSCCSSIFCEECIQTLKSCPNCRFRHPHFLPNKSLRRVIGFLPWICEYCNYLTENHNSEDHLKKCMKAPIQCKYCYASFIRENLMGHYIGSHQDQLIKDFGENPEPTKIDYNRIEDRVNSKGRSSKIGWTGKFYCEAILEPNCTCCNGFCGSVNGCNCVSCMILDIEARRLPKGYLINGEGNIAKIGDTGHVYCGRKVMRGVSHCDGWCGPNNGPNCRACRALERNWNGRYKAITSQWL